MGAAGSCCFGGHLAFDSDHGWRVQLTYSLYTGVTVATATLAGAGLGAEAGTVCGPGAIVCSPVLAVLGAIGGWWGANVPRQVGGRISSRSKFGMVVATGFNELGQTVWTSARV